MLQTKVPDQLRGRAFTLFDMTWGACRRTSLMFGGFVADAFGIQPLYWLGGSLLAFAGVVGLTGPSARRAAV